MKLKVNKNILIVGIILILIIVIFIGYKFFNEKNFIRLSYNEVMEKIDNKESFILCITAKKCTHCKDFKPKLKKVANKYDILIYYTDISSFTDEEYEEFKNTISFDGGTPATVFFKDGIEETTATRIEGDVSMDRIVDKIKKNGFIS